MTFGGWWWYCYHNPIYVHYNNSTSYTLPILVVLITFSTWTQNLHMFFSPCYSWSWSFTGGVIGLYTAPWTPHHRHQKCVHGLWPLLQSQSTLWLLGVFPCSIFHLHCVTRTEPGSHKFPTSLSPSAHCLKVSEQTHARWGIWAPGDTPPMRNVRPDPHTWSWVLEDILLHLRIDSSAKLSSHVSCQASVHHAAAVGQGRLRICCQLWKWAGRSRWGSWICSIVLWVGELLWSTLRKTGVPHLNWQSRWGREIVPKALLPHQHCSLLLY